MLEAIKQWAFTLVITAVVGGIANSFVISENGSMKKYVKFACSAVALAVMIMPVKELFREMPDIFNFNQGSYENYGEPEIYDLNELAITKTNELLKERISDIVYEKTGIKPDNVYIYIRQTENSEIDIEKIEIVWCGDPDTPQINLEEINLYLKQLFNCDVGRSDPDAPLIKGEEKNE